MLDNAIEESDKLRVVPTSVLKDAITVPTERLIEFVEHDLPVIHKSMFIEV